ncbi:WcaF family extracellular polysaccharide biosynthesis acetyltransferase [Vibrio owensii]|uniref:WcaF family extracellular polysaccharide biosynthesis acetyltransferase n=1 Tax=Vibrio owensii TaxID=696485 RepID=UPI0018F12879|nr:WcaF family extracellular polysaccharide biosynthesis acetyltransferase [Vibrio owensii]
MKSVKLNSYCKRNLGVKRKLSIAVWTCFNRLFFMSTIPYPSAFKRKILQFFGAEIGSNTVIKPRVCIKYPWNLKVAENVWIGEQVWIDNLGLVTIGNDVCISQGAYVLTGSHDYKSQNFDLIIGNITLKEGVWVGAMSVICPGVTLYSHSVLAVNSVAVGDMEPYCVYQGNPAKIKRKREIY